KPSRPQGRRTPDRVIVDMTASCEDVILTPAPLCKAFNQALPSTIRVRGVSWTKRGNLVIYPDPDICKASDILHHQDALWDIIWTETKRVQAVEGEGSPTPPTPDFFLDKPWHSVVIHNVPIPSGDPTPETLDEAIEELSN
ncbi:unnamed protein product, partial [Mycena citricolor]